MCSLIPVTRFLETRVIETLYTGIVSKKAKIILNNLVRIRISYSDYVCLSLLQERLLMKVPIFIKRLNLLRYKQKFYKMTLSAALYTDCKNLEQAIAEISNQVTKKFQNIAPDVLIIFAAPNYDHIALLKELQKSIAPKIIVGCSSAGEFTSTSVGTDSISGIALHSTEMQFFASIGRGIISSRDQVVEDLLTGMKGKDHFQYKYHTAMILADALSGYTDEIIEKLTFSTAGTYQFFGGGAGDNAEFLKTTVFFGTEVVPDAVVMLEILSNKPVGLAVSHGWVKGSQHYRVTEVTGAKVISLNAMPAVEVFEDYASQTNQHFDQANPIPFFLHNIIGIKTNQGYKLRVPLKINKDGSITCASDIPLGSLISIMSIRPDGSKSAAESATKMAMEQLNGHKANIGLFFDCVATRLRLGSDFNYELEAVKDAFKNTDYVGCNTHGQVARMAGQFSGFHNCSAVVCVIPE